MDRFSNSVLTIHQLQKNKTNSAVQLKHLPTGIVVKSQATRSRSQNRKQARELLAQKVDNLLHGEHSRSSIVGEVKRKKAASASKKSRRKYRQLEEDRAAATTPRAQESAALIQDETIESCARDALSTDAPRLQVEPDIIRDSIK
jgi:protein subunit release factor B